MPKDKDKKKKKNLPKVLQKKEFELPKAFKGDDQKMSKMDSGSNKKTTSQKSESKEREGMSRRKTKTSQDQRQMSPEEISKLQQEPETERPPEDIQDMAQNQPIIHRNKETGEIAAVELPDGRVFDSSGISQNQLKSIAESAQKEPTPKGSVEAKELRQQQEQQMRQFAQEQFNPQDVDRFLESVDRIERNLEPTAIQKEQALREDFKQRKREARSMLFGGSPEAQKSAVQMEAMTGIDRTLGILDRAIGDFGEDLLGVSPSAARDLLTNREETSELESSMGKLGETFAAIRGLGDNESVPTQEVIARLNQEEENLEILEDRIHKAASQKPSVKMTGEYVNILTEVEKTKLELIEARGDILQRAREGDKTLNLAETRRIMDKLGSIAKRDDKKEIKKRLEALRSRRK